MIDAKYLKDFRKKYNLTQIRLANILGVKKKTIEKWEQGKNPIKNASARIIYLFNKSPKLMDEFVKTSNKIEYFYNYKVDDKLSNKYFDTAYSIENIQIQFNWNISNNNKCLKLWRKDNETATQYSGI